MGSLSPGEGDIWLSNSAKPSVLFCHLANANEELSDSAFCRISFVLVVMCVCVGRSTASVCASRWEMSTRRRSHVLTWLSMVQWRRRRTLVQHSATSWTGLSVCLSVCLPVSHHSDHYTVSQVKHSHFYFYDNFVKCRLISTILSFLHLVINCGRVRSKRCHLTSYLLPHYLVKFECSIVRLLIYDSHSTLRSVKR